MRNKFTKQAQNALALAKAAAVDFELGYIGTEHLLLGLLSETEGTAGRVLEEFQVDGKKLVELIDKLVTPVDAGNVEVIDTQPVYSPRTQKVLDSAEAEAQSTGCEKAGTEHLLLAMLRETDCVGTRLLYTMGVNIQKLYASVLGAMGYDNESIQEEFQAARAMQQGQKGSVPPALDQYSRDLTQMAAEGRLDPVVGRDREITRLIQILSRRTKNNPCLVGEPGVGKTAIAEGLAQRIIAGTVPDTIRDKRLVVLDLSGMVAGSKYRGEFEERIRKVVDEVRENQGILLFIDELHTIIGAGGAEGALDASNILKPSLSRGELQIIGATTLEEYRKYIEKDAALERRFQPITVEEPSEEETYEILKGLRPYYERHHKVEILDEALEAAVKMSVRYINDRFLPDKAIDLIDEAASKVQLSGYQASTDSEELSREIQEILQEKEGAIKSGNLTLAKEYQQKQNQQGAVPEKGLRQEEDDGVGPPVKEPVGLSREKQSMEHHKGPLEVQGRQTAHREKDRRQSGRGPEAGTVPQRGGRDQLFPPAHGKQDRQDQRGEDQHPQVQQEEGAHIGEVGGPLRRGRKDPGGKVGAQSQAVIHHLPISPADLLRRQAVPGQLQGGNVGVIEGAAQDGGRHRGGQHQQGRSQSGQDAEEFTGLHGITSKNESADWYHTTDRSGTQGPADGKGADPETGPLLNRIQCWISAGGYGRRRACGHTR